MAAGRALRTPPCRHSSWIRCCHLQSLQLPGIWRWSSCWPQTPPKVVASLKITERLVACEDANRAEQTAEEIVVQLSTDATLVGCGVVQRRTTASRTTPAALLRTSVPGTKVVSRCCRQWNAASRCSVFDTTPRGLVATKDGFAARPTAAQCPSECAPRAAASMTIRLPLLRC